MRTTLTTQQRRRLRRIYNHPRRQRGGFCLDRSQHALRIPAFHHGDEGRRRGARNVHDYLDLFEVLWDVRVWPVPGYGELGCAEENREQDVAARC
jgi:hypothetical protein